MAHHMNRQEMAIIRSHKYLLKQDSLRKKKIISTHDTDPDAFRFYSPELEPLIPRDVQEKEKGVIESLIEEVDSSDPTSAQKCCSAAQSCCEIEARRYPGDDRIPSFTPLLKEKSNQGLRMMASFISPSLPRLFRDLWVVLELAVTIYQFVLACVSLVEKSQRSV